MLNNKKLRIAIISYCWLPTNAPNVQRVYGWVRYWQREGIDIHVFSAEPQFFDPAAGCSLNDIPVVPVTFIPYPEENGRFLFIANYFFGLNTLSKISQLFERYFRISPDMRRQWGEGFLIENEINSDNFDVVVSTFPPAASHFLAKRAKENDPKLFWVADFRDLWSRVPGKLARFWRRKLAKKERETLKNYADLITVATSDMLSEVKGGSAEIITVPNGFMDDKKEIIDCTDCIKTPSNPFRVCYTGRIYEDFQDPSPFLDAVANTLEKGLINEGEIIVDFYGENLSIIEEYKKNNHYTSFIRCHSKVDRNASLSAQRSSDLLLLLGPTRKIPGAFTSKIYEYMVSGVPVLCIGEIDNSPLSEVMQETKIGVMLDGSDVSQIEEIIMLTLSGGGVFDYFEPEIEKILQHSRESSSLDLLGEIQKRL